MKVLFVFNDDYPRAGACTSLLKNMFFRGNMINRIDQIDVLSVKYDLSQPSEEVCDGVHVFRSLTWNTISKKILKESLLSYPLTAFYGIFAKAKYNSFQSSHPDIFHYQPNIRTFLTSMSKIKAEQYDIIVAVLGNSDIAMAVQQFKEQHPGIRFVLYQVDPCATNYLLDSQVVPAAQKFEAELYQKADAIITTNIICDEFRQSHGGYLDPKFTSMEFPNVACASGPAMRCRTTGKEITCVFAGNIYRGIRDPAYTIALFKRLSKFNIKMIFVGSMGDYPEGDDLPDNIIFLGSKNLDETREILTNADILINIGNVMLNQVPSKLFEYISSGKPIVNVCVNRECPTIPYMNRYPLALNLFEDEDVEEAAEKLYEFVLKNNNAVVPSSQILDLYRECTPEYCANQMIKVFQDVLSSTR